MPNAEYASLFSCFHRETAPAISPALFSMELIQFITASLFSPLFTVPNALASLVIASIL